MRLALEAEQASGIRAGQACQNVAYLTSSYAH